MPIAFFLSGCLNPKTGTATTLLAVAMHAEFLKADYATVAPSGLDVTGISPFTHDQGGGDLVSFLPVALVAADDSLRPLQAIYDPITSRVRIFKWGDNVPGTVVADEAQTIPASPGPYTVVADHTDAVFTDQGVVIVAGSVAMTKVGSSPATGEYAVDESTGTYTFAAADAEVPILLNYRYGFTSTEVDPSTDLGDGDRLYGLALVNQDG